MVQEEDLEDQVLEVMLLLLVLKDQVDLVTLEVFHHQKEMMVELEPIQITEVLVAVAVLLQQEHQDQDIQEQPEEMEHQTKLQDQMYLTVVAEVLVQIEVTQVLTLDLEELVAAEPALVEPQVV
jgi:hypothetical protein